jgi:large subunit ribosomal protein L6
MKIDLEETITLPEGVTLSVEGLKFTVKGPKGEITRKRTAPQIQLTQEGNDVKIFIKNGNKKDKTSFYTLSAHLVNMIAGVQEPWVYTLKICSGHFPMQVKAQGNEFSVVNLIGEKVPRTMKIAEGADVNIQGADITVTSVDIEKAGRVASDIENLTRVTNKDRRVYQDGIYITSKAGTPVK